MEVLVIRFGPDEETKPTSYTVLALPNEPRVEARRRLITNAFPGAEVKLEVISGLDKPTIQDLRNLLDQNPMIIELDVYMALTQWTHSTLEYFLERCVKLNIPVIWWEIDEAQYRPMVVRMRERTPLNHRISSHYFGTLYQIGFETKPATM